MKFTHKKVQAFLYLALFAYANSIHASTCGNSDFNVEVKASYLYWNAQEDSLGFGIENVAFFQPAPTSATLKTHDNNWGSGFRAEVFLSNTCSPIGCHFEWTYFRAKTSASANGSAASPIGVTTASNLESDNPFLVAPAISSRWKVNINELAFDFDYRLCPCCCPCISFRPYVGIFGAIIDQKQTVFNTDTIGKNMQPLSIIVSRKNNFWGVGPRIGMGATWNFTEQFSLICNANAAYLMGHISIHNNFQYIPTTSSLTAIDKKAWCARPMISTFVGLNWEACSLVNCAAFSLSVGYEFQYWWKQWYTSSTPFAHFLSGSGRWADLSLNGLVVSADFSF